MLLRTTEGPESPVYFNYSTYAWRLPTIPFSSSSAGCRERGGVEFEIELIQSHMAQKPVLRGEVGARALRVRSVSREGAWASADEKGAWVSRCECEAD